MLLRCELRREDVAHNPLLVDNIGDAARQQSESRRDAVLLSERATGIAEQDVGQAVLHGETLVRINCVGADADYFCARIFEDFVAITKGTRLGGTAGRVVLALLFYD